MKIHFLFFYEITVYISDLFTVFYFPNLSTVFPAVSVLS